MTSAKFPNSNKNDRAQKYSTLNNNQRNVDNFQKYFFSFYTTIKMLNKKDSDQQTLKIKRVLAYHIKQH